MRILLLTTFILASCFMTFISHKASATKLTNQFHFNFTLDGNNHIPKVATDGHGLGTAVYNFEKKELYVTIIAHNLSGPITGVHLHEGYKSENGPEIISLTDGVQDGIFVAKIVETSLLDIDRLFKGGYYVHVHTDQNPDGEIRGNLSLETDLFFYTNLSGTEVVPEVTTEAQGLSVIRLSKNLELMEVMMVSNGLSGDITGIHLHDGAKGANGNIAIGLDSLMVSSNSLKGLVKNVSSDFVTKLLEGSVYLQAHTQENVSGEIRGQMVYNAGISFSTWIDGENQKPNPITSDAKGLGVFFLNNTMDILQYSVLYNGEFSSEVKGAHLHKGDNEISSGPVVLEFATPTNNALEGSFSSELTTEILSDLVSGNLYLQTHTANNPDGEIRGQVYRLARESFYMGANSKQHIHDVTSTGRGWGFVSVDPMNYNAHIAFVNTKMQAEIKGIHIHEGAEGTIGGHVYDIDIYGSLNGDWSRVEGYWSYDHSKQPFNSDNVMKLENGQLYINVHTSDFSLGEIRGQINGTGYPTSIINKSINADQDIQLYPNPVSDSWINIEYDGQNDLSIKVYDFLGNKVIENKSSEGKIDVSSLPKGNYIIQINDQYSNYHSKFVKE